METLICQRIVLPFDLKNFRLLKELSIYPNNDELPIVENLKKQRALLKRNSLSILVYGCENLENKSAMTFGMIKDSIVHVNMLSNARLCSFDSDSYIRYYRLKDKAMYEELARLYPRMIGITMPWHFLLDYPTLVECFEGSIPANFFTKFTTIRAIIVIRQVENEEKLIEFVKKSSPKRLVLKNIHLSESFYDQLAWVDSIESLTLDGDLSWTQSSFASRMRGLSRIMWEGTRKFPLTFVLKTFRESASFRQIMFYKLNFGHVILIKKTNCYSLHIEYPCEENRVFSKLFYPKSEDELFGHKQLMENFVD